MAPPLDTPLGRRPSRGVQEAGDRMKLFFNRDNPQEGSNFH
jgi:hypothetical protein